VTERRKSKTNKLRITKIVLDCKHCPRFGKMEKSCEMTSSVIPEVCPLPKAWSMAGRIIVAQERKDDYLLS
jgi:hypothetical protein